MADTTAIRAHQFALNSKNATAETCLWCWAGKNLAGEPCQAPRTPAELAASSRKSPSVRNGIEWLCTRFPATFPVARTKVRPLAIGIREAIMTSAEEDANSPDEKWIVKALTWWCHRPVYLRAVAAGKKRRNLEGERTERTSDDERARAKIQIQEIRAARMQTRSPADA